MAKKQNYPNAKHNSNIFPTKNTFRVSFHLHAILKSIGGSAQSIWPAISTQSWSLSVSNSPSRTNILEIFRNYYRENGATNVPCQRMLHTNLLNHLQLEHPHNVRRWQSFVRQYMLHRIPMNRFAFCDVDSVTMQPKGNHRWLYFHHQQSVIAKTHKINLIKSGVVVDITEFSDIK